MEQKTQAKMLRDQLENATGEPEHVVAVNLDVRGFSSFCERNESANVVVFIREVYKRIIDRYFRQAPFVKTTGDGLLIVIPCTKDSLGEVANQTLQIRRCMHACIPLSYSHLNPSSSHQSKILAERINDLALRFGAKASHVYQIGDIETISAYDAPRHIDMGHAQITWITSDLIQQSSYYGDRLSLKTIFGLCRGVILSSASR